MATDLEKLVVQLSADIKGYEREMRKAVGVTNRQARDIEKRFLAMQRNLDGIGSRAAKSLIAPFTGIAAALGGRELIRMTGQWTDLTSRVNLAAGSMEKGNEVMQRVSEMARRTYSDLSQTAEGYLAFSTTLTELGVSTDRQLDFVESLNNALVVSGAKGQTAERVMSALSKAMALGSLQGDNLNTVIESGGRVSQALADSMGVTTMELRKLGQEGKIGRKEILGISKEMEKLRAEAAEMPATIQDGFMLLNNALLEYVGRADDAVGMSGRIGEALTIIADNFDTVADAGLKLAAVLAAGMLGRSISGMIANLGAATGVLVKFGAALRAATSMAGVGAAIGGLSAAAGPLGMAIGGLLAGGVFLYSDAAARAEERSRALREELRDMGLYSPDAASALKEVAEAADGIGTEDQLERIERLKRGLNNLRGEYSFSSQVFGDFSDIGRIIGDINKQERWFMFSALSRESLSALQTARELATEYQKTNISAAQLLDGLSDISRKKLDEPAQDLLRELDNVARAAIATEAALTMMGASPSIEAANEQLIRLREHLDRMADTGQLDADIVASMDRIIQKFVDGEESAEDARAAIAALGAENPSFKGAIAAIDAVIGRLGALRAEAVAATVALRVVTGGGAASDGDTSLEKEGAATQAFLDEQRRRNALSREQQDIEKRTAQIMKDAASSQAVITEEQARQLAIEQAAADARRAAEGKAERASGGGGRTKAGGGRSKGGKTVTDIFEDAGAEIENLERQLVLVGKSVEETARLRSEWAMLDAAKKAGILIDEKTSKNIAEQAVHIGHLADQLSRAEIAQQQFEQAIDGIADAFAGALVAGESLRDGLAQVFKQIAADILRSGIRAALVDQFSATGGGGGGVLSNVLGKIFGGFRAAGGPVQAGKAYVVGEKGPEPFVPAVNGRILSVAQVPAVLSDHQRRRA